MTMLSRFSILLVIATLPLLAACDSTEPDSDGAGEQEFITRVSITLQGSGAPVTVSATDPDGTGTNLQIGTLTLRAGETYDGTVSVYDDINEEDVGAEIEEEAEDHQFFYTPAGGIASRVGVLVTDEDANGLPVGLTFRVTVTEGPAATGTLNVALAHFDNEPKNGVDRGGETDIDITFPVVIE